MPDFSNQYQATVDDKGRVVLPAAYKRELGEGSERLISVEYDPYEKCLNLYPMETWAERIAHIKSKLNPNDPKQSKLLDKFYQRFVKVPVAENGRVNIPKPFMDGVGIVREVMFSGQGDRIRLWDVAEFNKAMMPDEDFGDLFQQFLGGAS